MSAIREVEEQRRLLSDSNLQLKQAYDEIKAREETLTAEIAERIRVQEAYERQQEQLRQSQKMEAIGNLSGGIAHDFNNHLTVILLYAEATLDAENLTIAKECAEHIRNAAETSAGLTRQLLAFARKQNLNPKVTNLNDLIGKLDNMLIRTLGERVKLEFVRGAGLGKVMVDPGQLEQALVNLVINARDAIDDKAGRLIVETANVYLDREYAEEHGDLRPGRYVMLAVSDDGPGIPEDEMRMVFEPFFTTKEAGTGLGLSMVQGFVTQSGGAISVRSEPGQGTTFKIFFPRVDRDVSLGDSPEMTVFENEESTETILVVEDESALCDLVTKKLSSHGYKVISAKDGDEALRKSKDVDIDLVVTDVVMPGMNGPELVDQLRHKHSKLSIVYMTGYTDNAHVRRAELNSDETMLEKPFTSRGLLRTVSDALKKDGVQPK